MAQTKRKRQTKHRGNAAGVVESRGRTGRKPTAAEKSGKAREQKKVLEDKRDRPPTWRTAFIRAMFAAVLMMLVTTVLLNRGTQAIALFPIVLLLYWPISFYTDRWMFRNRQRKKLQQRGGGRAAPR
jgi:hypothetical protein